VSSSALLTQNSALLGSRFHYNNLSIRLNFEQRFVYALMQAAAGDKVLINHLGTGTAPRNAHFLSPIFQNEIIDECEKRIEQMIDSTDRPPTILNPVYYRGIGRIFFTAPILIHRRNLPIM
jgi:hypothetical protein